MSNRTIKLDNQGGRRPSNTNHNCSSSSQYSYGDTPISKLLNLPEKEKVTSDVTINLTININRIDKP